MRSGSRPVYCLSADVLSLWKNLFENMDEWIQRMLNFEIMKEKK